MKKQTLKDKENEHLGAKHGAESKHKQSMKDRRHEMKGAMKHKKESDMDKLIKKDKKKIDHMMDTLVKKDIPRDKKIHKCDKNMMKKKKK